MSARTRNFDLLAHLEQQRAEHGGVFPRPGGGVYVADPALARAVLGNTGGDFREHSDFFKLRSGTFGPRSAQVGIGRAARRLLQRHAETRTAGLPDLVERCLAPVSSWPDAGNRLLLEFGREALIGADPSAALRDTVHAVVERAVLAGARERHSRPARAVFRARVMRVLSREIAARRGRPSGAEPGDLLDVVAAGAVDGTADRDLAEVYLSGLFALVGSVGFLLGWSVYLLGTSRDDPAAAEPGWVVREALRLWPVAWLFARRPERALELGGRTVDRSDDVVVCGYLVHRDPGQWTDPHVFRPQRWAAASGREAFVPFGWGPHSCVAAGFSLRTVERIVENIVSAYRIEVDAPDPRPQIAAALAPPRFTLALTRLPSSTERR
jgi:cytochrome P450